MDFKGKYFSQTIPETNGIKSFKKTAGFQIVFTFPLPIFLTG